jgi:hypothetical protein
VAVDDGFDVYTMHNYLSGLVSATNHVTPPRESGGGAWARAAGFPPETALRPMLTTLSGALYSVLPTPN